MGADPSTGLFWDGWTVPKPGLRPDQNEDAWAVRPIPNGWLIAVADGATEAVYAGEWAQALVAAAGPDWPTLDGPALDDHVRRIGSSFAPEPAGEALPWFVDNKVHTQGSQAALLVATVTATTAPGRYAVRAVAVGDCCLLQITAVGSVRSFPLHASADFGVEPALVRSQGAAPAPWQWAADTLGPGDLILAASDAVARWILECLETGRAESVAAVLAGLLGRPPDPADGPAPPEPLARTIWDRVRGTLGRRRRSGPAGQSDAPVGHDLRQADGPVVAPDDWVTRCRAPDAMPRMRADDSTLVLGVPVDRSAANPLAGALAAIRGFRRRATGDPLTVGPLEPVPSADGGVPL